ncbi:uncharacterized protein [Arachis hypogaea]|uniref:uncharacterized protein isoform X8 n=1 Tax=Arachis hypogaea TaxID=3818 RepID=UPI003B20C561
MNKVEVAALEQKRLGIGDGSVGMFSSLIVRACSFLLLQQIPFIQMKISFIEENNAGNAAAALMARLAPKAKDLPTTVFLLVKLTQRHLRLPGISMRRSGEWGDHLTLQAAADKGIAYAQSNVNKSKKKN